LKVASSLWIKEGELFPRFKGWGKGYGAFTFSLKEKDALIEYIKNQKEHHKKINFLDEYKDLLIKYDIIFDEKKLDMDLK